MYIFHRYSISFTTWFLTKICYDNVKQIKFTVIRI